MCKTVACGRIGTVYSTLIMEGRTQKNKKVRKVGSYCASVLIHPGVIHLERKALPEPGRGEALVEVHYAGICGTDIALYTGDYKVALPLTLGHEWTGEVAKVNDTRKSLVGKLVTGEINVTCASYKRGSRCAACERNMSPHCLKRTVTGITRDGAFAQYLVVPVRNLHMLPPDVSAETGVLVEPLAAALQTFEMTPVNENTCVVVLGTGRLGTLITFVARQMGARVIAVSRSTESRRRAAFFGAETLLPDDPAVLIAHVKKYTGGLGADIVVEATGNPDSMNLALELVRPRGTVALKSTPGTPAKLVNLTKIVVDEIRIQGSRCGPFDKAIELLSSHAESFARLITTVLPLQEIEEGLRLAQEGGKVVIKCRV